eukprot:8777329-Pyramimonas_sp.AAC.1
MGQRFVQGDARNHRPRVLVVPFWRSHLRNCGILLLRLRLLVLVEKPRKVHVTNLAATAVSDADEEGPRRLPALDAQ